MKYIIEAKENKSLQVQQVDHLMSLTIQSTDGTKESILMSFNSICELATLLKEYKDNLVCYAYATAISINN
jgi:hypothetical protein